MRNDLHTLVVSEAVAVAELVASLLREEFGQVLLSTKSEGAAKEFEQRKQVMVLALSELERAERYYLDPYRRSTVIQELPHRTLILSNRHDLQRVYELAVARHALIRLTFASMHPRRKVVCPAEEAT